MIRASFFQNTYILSEKIFPTLQIYIIQINGIFVKNLFEFMPRNLFLFFKKRQRRFLREIHSASCLAAQRAAATRAPRKE